MPLVVTGSVGIDTVYTPSAAAQEVLGGSCTYFAAAASFLGPVRVVAAVGEDFDPRFLEFIKDFRGIDLSGLETRPGAKTFRWTGKYRENMDERDTLDVQVGVLGEAPPPVPAAFRDSHFVFLANGHPANQLQFLEAFPQRRLVVADTMDLWINTQRAALEALLQRVDGLVLNYSEAEMLAGHNNPVKAAHLIRERMGPTFVVVKKGEHGSLLVHQDGVAVLPAFPLENVIDPTGAGDSFAGGLMGHLSATQRIDFSAIQHALTFGTVLSSFTVEAFSLDRLRAITINEINDRMLHFARAVRVV